MVCSVPLDNSWATNLTGDDLLAFVPLAHEVVYHLASARSADFTLRPGQPLRYRIDTEGVNVAAFTLEPPLGEARPLSTNPADKATYPVQVDRLERGAMLVYDGAR